MYCLWLWLALVSGILLGFYDIFKKKALERDSLFKVLALYAVFCFILVSFEFSNALAVKRAGLFMILLKSFVLFLSWIMNFLAIKNLPISVITPFATLSPVFSIFFGVLLLNERLHYNQVAGIGIILSAYYIIGRVGAAEVKGLFKNKYLYLMAASMFLSAISALIDKIALKSVNSGQMQFWFSLFLSILYILALVVNNIFIRHRSSAGKEEGRPDVKKTMTERIRSVPYFIIFMSIFLVLSDRIYYYAVKIPESQISVIMPLRKISVLVSVMAGGILFKEKNIKAKLGGICLLIAGITLIFMGKQ